jgi:peptide subunit release factor 1 (eRF1)
LLEFLKGLETTDDSAAITLYLPPGLSAGKIQDLLKSAADEAALPVEMAEIIARSRNGGVLFWANKVKYLVSPPFPLKEQAVFAGFNIGPLRNLLEVDYRIGLVLVHLGAYAVGLCHGEKLTTSKVGTGLVHGRHKKGGSSQQRFRRRRENQAAEFLDRVCLHAREQFESQAQSIDYMVYGGPRQTVMQLQKRCLFLKSFEDRVLPPLDVPDPRREILEKAVGRIWSSRVTEWREEG